MCIYSSGSAMKEDDKIEKENWLKGPYKHTDYDSTM